MSFSRGFHLTLIVFSLLVWKSGARAQLPHSPVDSGLVYAEQTYFEAKGKNSGLYSGYRYKTRTIHKYDEGHPFFISDDWQIGSIEHNGLTYSDVKLLYDVVSDNIIVQNAYNFLKIELINDRVPSFTLRGHHFVNLSHKNTSGLSIQPGFYELLYDGEIKVFARRKKEAIEKLESGLTVTKFNTIDRYYIYKGGEYFSVKSKSSVLNVFQDQKPDLNRHLSKSKIRFNRNRELAMFEMARFYEDSKE